MKPASLRRIGNMRRLVTELSERGMGPCAVAELLRISHSAARNYLQSLEEAGVAHGDPERRTTFRLHPDPAVVEWFLADLEERETHCDSRVSLRRSASRHCSDPGARFLHVLADDVRFPLVLDCCPARRDPLVAALFGAAARPAIHQEAQA